MDPRHHVNGNIPDSGADFQNTVSDVGPNHIGHPLVKPRRAIHAVKNLAACCIYGVNSAGRRIVKDGPQARERHPSN